MHMLQEEAGTLTNQGTGEVRDEALKRGVVVLKPSNKGVGDLTLLSGSCYGSLGSPILRSCLLLRFLDLTLKVADTLLSQAQGSLSCRQLTRWDKALADLLCLRSSRLESLVRLLDDGKFFLHATLRSKPVG